MSLTNQEMSVTYENFIDNILNTRGRHSCGEEYHEKHHIVPKCLGGEDKEENYIDLFAREHYEAHRLLAQEYPQESKLQYAWWMMVNCTKAKTNQRNYACAIDYEKARIAFAQAKSNDMKNMAMPKNVRQKIAKTKTGSKSTLSTRKKISQNHADIRGAKHPRHKPIICVETKKLYWGITQAGKELGLDISSLGATCKGRHKTCGGLHWRYATQEEIRQEELANATV